jgi:hypothetical protein
MKTGQLRPNSGRGPSPRQLAILPGDAHFSEEFKRDAVRQISERGCLASQAKGKGSRAFR